MAFQKPPNVIVLPEQEGGCRIVRPHDNYTVYLDRLQAQAWFNGDLDGLENLRENMLARGLIRTMKDEPLFLARETDELVPRPASHGMRFYCESPELMVLFNTASLCITNPLIVLGPYGSVVWQGILHEATIGEIRKRVLRLFGNDEVVPFLTRLMSLGFVQPLEQIQAVPPVKECIDKELFPPQVQFMLPHSKVPWYCLWEINTLCDVRCQICYLREYKNAGPDAEALEQILEQIDQVGIFYVTLLGGEALLRPDLEQVILRLRQSDIFVKLITNGHLLTAARARTLAQAGLNQVEVSFDGLTASSHEMSRGRGSFAAALDALKNAQQVAIPRVGIVFTVYSQNIQELVGLPTFMQEQRVRECYLSLFRKTGLMGGRSQITPLSAQELAQARLLTQQWRKTYPDLDITLLPDCTCGRTSVVIGADNSLRPCPSSYDSAMGNLLETPLPEAWDRIGKQARTGILWCKPSPMPAQTD